MFLSNKEYDNIDKILIDLENLLNQEINRVSDMRRVCKGRVKGLEDRLINYTNDLQERNEEELKVYGEIMLSCEKLSDGFTDDVISAKTQNPKISYISKTVNDMSSKISAGLKHVHEILKEYENQDYRKKTDVEFFRGGEFRAIFEGINSLRDKITENFIDNYRLGRVLETSAENLKHEAAILSEESNAQAVAVEELSAAVTEISESIGSNSMFISNMGKNSKELHESVDSGQKLSKDTYDAMEKINVSTQAVYESIGIISKIAFQTNILSLNAAVEAATAGEAGRGFAVVAGEVRNLANRSADAAKEIESLMDELKRNSDTGKSIASKMKEGYESLDGKISSTLDFIRNVDENSKEQAKNIEVISSSTSQIDMAIQHNASIAEKVSMIARDSYEVSKQMVEHLEDIEFEGKESAHVRGEAVDRNYHGKERRKRN